MLVPSCTRYDLHKAHCKLRFYGSTPIYLLRVTMAIDWHVSLPPSAEEAAGVNCDANSNLQQLNPCARYHILGT